ncbi:MAG: tetratricopeptide repeat protein, partial [Gammaproteobacteria bacterium]
YERSIAIDPSYAEPYARLARVHTYPWITGLRTSREESLDTALRLARRSVELDAELAVAQGMLSWVCAWSGLHDEAVPAARRSVVLDPGGAESHYWLGVSLSCSGFNHEAERELILAMRYDPHCPVYYLWARAQNYLFMRRYADAIELAEQAVRMAPTFVGGYVVLTTSHALTGRTDDARRMAKELTRLFPGYCEHRRQVSIGYKPELADIYREGMKRIGL